MRPSSGTKCCTYLWNSGRNILVLFSKLEKFNFNNKITSSVLLILSTASVIHAIHQTIVYDGCLTFQWDSAKILLNGLDPYKMTLSHTIPETEKFKTFAGSPYFPSCLMLLWPYALIQWPLAEYLWIISNILFTFLFLYNIFNLFLPNRPYQTYLLIISLLLLGFQWRYLIYTGEQTLFALCFFSFALRYVNKRPLLSGLFLALSFLKYPLTIPLSLYFLYKRKYLPLLIASFIHLGLHIFISFWIKINPITLITETLKVDTLCIGVGYLDFVDVFRKIVPSIPMIYPVLLSLFLLMAAIYVCWLKPNIDDLFILNMLSFISLAVVYHGRYDYIILIFPILLYFKFPVLDLRFKTLVFLIVLLTWYLDHEGMINYLISVLHSKYFLFFLNIYNCVLPALFWLTTVCSLILVFRKSSNDEINLMS